LVICMSTEIPFAERS